MKSFLQIENLTKSFGDRVLFSDVTFGIYEGDKIGLIAKNGSGKTTLLRIIAGEESYDSGSLVFRNDLRVGYLKQLPELDPNLSVIEACLSIDDEPTAAIRTYERALASGDADALAKAMSQMDAAGAWDYEDRIRQTLTQLKIIDMNQPVGQLSGGQVKRVALAKVVINEPELLILDEPTNHLDIDMIEWLESYLQRSRMSLLMVTHDRYFLDKVCSKIVEIDSRQVYAYNGNYDYYLEKREERLSAQSAELAKVKNLLRTELDWMRRQPQARGSKAKYRIDAFHDLTRRSQVRRDDADVQLNVKSTYIGSKIFDAVDVTKAYGDKVILNGFEYTFARYEKVGIVGNNGTGKSTFVKMLLGLEQPDSGRIVIGDTVRFGYFSQEGLKFDEGQKVIDVVRDIADYIDLGGGRHLTASQFLQHFLFTPEQQHNYVSKLSGGERRKLYLCTVLMRNPNFLVLDEPTNDLDIVTLQILEEYLADFPGCVIVVSHDRYFMDKVVDHLLVFKGDGVIKDFPGNYTQYRAWSSLQSKAEVETEAKVRKAAPQQPRHEARRRMTYKERMEFAELEKDIAALEEEKKSIEEALCSGTLSVAELTEKSKRLPLLNEELDEKSMRWLELSEIENK